MDHEWEHPLCMLLLGRGSLAPDKMYYNISATYPVGWLSRTAAGKGWLPCWPGYIWPPPLPADRAARPLRGKRILDCPSGACSFTAVANRRGVDVTAADIAYFYAPEELERKGLQDLEHAMGHMEKAQANSNRKYEHAEPLLEYIDGQSRTGKRRPFRTAFRRMRIR